MPKWRVQDLNLVKGAAKQRQSEDRLRAEAWRKEREAELEAIVNRAYDGSEHPQLVALVERFREVVAPLIAEYDRVCAEIYPAEFSRPRLYWGVAAGGFPEKLRDKVRRWASVHLRDRHAYMLANSAGFTTGIVTDASKRTTDNPEVVEMLDKLAVANRATPVLQAPGPAIGVITKLLPHPEEGVRRLFRGRLAPAALVAKCRAAAA
jgi:hypothetical protein